MTDLHTEPLRAAADVAAVAGRHSAAVDSEARVPHEALAALKEARLLAACAPSGFGGPALDVPILVAVARALAAACGSTAMVWSMHQGQLACLCRHAGDRAALRDLALSAVAEQWLIASVTSEAGVGGDIRSSVAAVEPAGAAGQVRLVKDATTVSYGAVADLFMITARRGRDAAPNDQVMVAVRRDQAEIRQSGDWQPLGMRGTASPGFHVDATVGSGQVLPDPFSDIAAATMVPLTQTLWAATWAGLAAEAVRRAVRAMRRRVATKGLEGLPRALGEARWRLGMIDALVDDMASRTQAWLDGAGGSATGFSVRSNSLKVGVSELALEVAQFALSVLGVGGYSEDGASSVARIIRDLHSARIMLGNERLTGLISQQMLMERPG